MYINMLNKLCYTMLTSFTMLKFCQETQSFVFVFFLKRCRDSVLLHMLRKGSTQHGTEVQQTSKGRKGQINRPAGSHWLEGGKQGSSRHSSSESCHPRRKTSCSYTIGCEAESSQNCWSCEIACTSSGTKTKHIANGTPPSSIRKCQQQ